MGAVSLEALAMADVNHLSFGLDADEWERRNQCDSPPPHLLLDEEDKGWKDKQQEQEDKEEKDDEREVKKKKKCGVDVLDNDDDQDVKKDKKRDIHGADMQRCLNIWVNKVVRDARKYRILDERRDCH